MDVSDNWGTPRQDTGIAFHASRDHISQLVLGGDVLGHPSGAPARGCRGSPPPACWIGRRSRQLHKAASTPCSFHSLFSLRMRGLDGISLLGGCPASFTLEPTRSPPIRRPPRPPGFPSGPAGRPGGLCSHLCRHKGRLSPEAQGPRSPATRFLHGPLEPLWPVPAILQPLHRILDTQVPGPQCGWAPHTPFARILISEASKMFNKMPSVLLP